MTTSTLRSALYIGQVRHRRMHPVPHLFHYRIFMLYLDLCELNQVFHKRWFWSVSRPSLARFDRRDHFGNPAIPLDDCVRELVQRETGHRPDGPIRLLTHLRYLGYCFNPISIYYCFDQHERLTALVAEVTSTPWGERCCYVLDASTSSKQHRAQFAKTMHVSPFMPMDLAYDWRYNDPNQVLAVHMAVLQNSTKIFDATLTMRRQPITGLNLARMLIRFPWMSAKVILAIYWEALRLWLKRLPVVDHTSSSKTC